jgi:two-component system chemotaxis response regulator CheY
MLKLIGFEVTPACHGREALTILGHQPAFDLALVDWNMPEMDGLEFIRTARADDRYAGLPLIMVTTETELSRVSQALEAGANEYVMKPFTLDVIKDKLDMLGIVPIAT